MTRWTLAVALALFAAFLAYGRSATPGQRGKVALLALLRFGAVLLVAALALGAPAAPPKPSAPIVALDASASWLRGGGDDSATVRALHERWRRIVDTTASGLNSDDILLFGDSVRDAGRDAVGTFLPRDASSRVRGAVDRAAALGRPLVIVTDGEIDDAEAIADAPLGSRIAGVTRDSLQSRRLDVALADLVVPLSATAGDTLNVSVLLTAGAGGSPDGALNVTLDNTAVARVPVPALGAFTTTRLSLPVLLPHGARTAMVQTTLQVAGDVEPRNDTLSAAVEILDRPAVVFVSTAPDLDVREALVVLRGALALPTKAYLRIAPGSWREEGSLAPINEDDVRARVANAGVLIVHGDTAWAQNIRAAGQGASRGARALWSPAAPTTLARAGETTRPAEWYATGAPLSPMSSSLSGIPWDSLPPITLAGLPRGSITVIEAKLGRRGEAVPAVALRESGGTRTVVISGSGYAGWSMRGGRSAEAFAALWGTIFDWLAVGRGDLRAARPASSSLRSGVPVRWRRGGPDSVVSVTITPRATAATSTAATDTAVIRFTGGSVEATTAALPPGVYDIAADGGPSVLVVNASREWVPRPPTVKDGVLSRGVLSTESPRLSDAWWPFLIVLLLLSGEWVARRAVGLR